VGAAAAPVFFYEDTDVINLNFGGRSTATQVNPPKSISLLLLGFLLSVLAPFVTEYLRDLWEWFKTRSESEAAKPTCALNVVPPTPQELHRRTVEFIRSVAAEEPRLSRKRLFANYLALRCRKSCSDRVWDRLHADGKVQFPSTDYR